MYCILYDVLHVAPLVAPCHMDVKAAQGFIDIRTFSCLERPYELKPADLAEANLSTPPNVMNLCDLSGLFIAPLA